jgi:uncharacterized protein (TIGR03437 family)
MRCGAFRKLAGGMFAVCLGSVCLAQSYTIQSVVGGGGYSGGPFPAPASTLYLDDTTGVAADSSGNIYFGGGTDNVIYKESGGTVSVVAGTVFNGAPNAGYSGDGGPATSALLNNPQGVAVDSAGNLYIVDYLNYAIREVLASNGTIKTIAGTGSYGRPVPGRATASPLWNPAGIAVDSNGNVYVSVGSAGGFIVKIANGMLSIVAGVGYEGPVTSGAQGTTQPLIGVSFISVDSAGNVYMTSDASYVLELVVSTGVLNILAGNGMSGYSGDGGPATSAMIFPSGVAVDASGNLYIADGGNEAIRKVSNGTITTIAGMPTHVGTSCSVTPLPGTSSYVSNTSGIAVSGAKIYYSDSQGCINELTPAAAGPPSIQAGGVVTASAWGDFTSTAPGSWIEIYGSNLAVDARPWQASDFVGNTAPTQLDGTSLTIAGQSAFIDYISPLQIDAQVPSNLPSGPQQLVVTTPSGAMATSTIIISQTDPGMLAPASFIVGGKQYVAALFPDNATFVMPAGAVSGVTSRPASPGDTIIMYGIGFGTVTPNTPAGQFASGQTKLTSSLNIYFAGTAANLTYQGLSPGSIGLYQFDLVVPSVAAGNLVPVTFTLGGVAGAQTLYTAIQ